MHYFTPAFGGGVNDRLSTIYKNKKITPTKDVEVIFDQYLS